MPIDSNIPEFCGFSCPHADFPPADSAGICRTMAAVHCRKLNRLVDKNGPCQVRKAAGGPGGAAPRRRARRKTGK